uniref:Uncharacterized protein n=1 Tax=Romanomermis culicivorax TaxID=13658 RepID=A0A915K7A4_ROMCU
MDGTKRAKIKAKMEVRPMAKAKGEATPITEEDLEEVIEAAGSSKKIETWERDWHDQLDCGQTTLPQHADRREVYSNKAEVNMRVTCQPLGFVVSGHPVGLDAPGMLGILLLAKLRWEVDMQIKKMDDQRRRYLH